ncbi:MAG: hypothetical protein GX587_03915 [Bacteroidales bacterium]|nr:hypothetical protein [Bacteroidales bacterium]
MDTDDLSREAYDGIIIEAEKLSHDLTLQYGLLSYHCENETEYIHNAEKLTREFMKAKHEDLVDIFFGNLPQKEKLASTLQQILKNIENIKSIPLEKRTYDF